MTLGDKIKNLRRQKGMTQQQLADACDVRLMTISNYETGKYTPRQKTLEKIAEVLGVTVESLQDEDAFVFAPTTGAGMIVYDDPNPEEIEAVTYTPEIDYAKIGKIMAIVEGLNEQGLERALQYIEDLQKLTEYRHDN